MTSRLSAHFSKEQLLSSTENGLPAIQTALDAQFIQHIKFEFEIVQGVSKKN